MKRLFAPFAFIFFALWAIFAAPVALADDSPDGMIKDLTDEVLKIVRTDKDIQSGNQQKANQLVETLILPRINFQRMTSLAVGKDWNKANAQQKQALTNEFRTLLVRTYTNAIFTLKQYTVSYKPTKMAAGDAEAVVRAEAKKPGGAPVQVDYNVEKQGNEWKVFDVSVGGVSLVTNYRDAFGQEVRNGGIDGLIQSLVNKNKSGDKK